MGARGQSPFGSKFCPGYRIVPVPEYATDCTALAPIALSAACRRLAASCAAAGPISTADVTNRVPSWIFILLLPESVPRHCGRPTDAESRKAHLGICGAYRHGGKTSQGDCGRKAELLSDRGEFCRAA